jgi:hypothetical protein
MKLTSLSKSVRTIGLITILSTIQGMSIVKTAQAQADINAGAVCTAAYFDNPGYMYNPSEEAQKARQKVRSASPKLQEQYKRAEKMMDDITAFSAPLDSPMGYVKSDRSRNTPCPNERQSQTSG